MSIYSKLAVFIILFTFLVGCKAKSPTSSSSDDSSSTSTDTGTDTGTGTTSYVGKWVKLNDNTIAMDWRSDSFIYACLVSTYTYAAQGSYSSSNSRLTMWDGSYGTVTSSGSNFIFGGATTYVPAILFSTCNPFWTNSTSENTYYTNAAKAIGYWAFTYTYGSYTYTDYKLMSTIASRTYSDGNYYTYGTDSGGNVVTGGYLSSSGIYDILDPSASAFSDYYTFTINSTYTGISSGCYYYYNKSNSTYSSCSSLSGTKLYGTPRSYRIISEDNEDTIALQKQKAMTKLMNQSSTRITAEDINAYNRYQQLLRIHNQTVKNKSLKKYLQSFRTN